MSESRDNNGTHIDSDSFVLVSRWGGVAQHMQEKNYRGILNVLMFGHLQKKQQLGHLVE